MGAIDISELAASVLQQQRSTPGLVADAIRLAIVRGQLAPGQSLRQEELAKQFGLSRVPVREALRQLEAEGLIVSYPHRGSAVAVLTANDVEEVFLVRVSRKYCFAACRSENDPRRYSQSRCGTGAYGFRFQPHSHGRIELGVSPKPVLAVRIGKTAAA